jgi:pilus assembly protein Flp/PilA
MFGALRKLGRDQAGVTVVEYALLAALIALGISVAAGTLATDISTAFTNIGTKVLNASTTTS